MNPLVSIIIPTYNRARLIGETLDSVLAQTYQNWECIIVDDGSGDDTGKFVSNYVNKDSRFQFHTRPNDRPKGANSCRNYGFERSKGKYINWFDSDDLMEPDFLLEKANAFQNTTQAVLHKNRYANYKLTRFRESKFNFTTTLNLFYHYAMDEIEIQTCGFMWEKDFLQKKGLFDETLERYQDNDFHIRMLALKPEIIVIHKVLATIRGGDGDRSQISSKVTLNKKKLYDVFHYRYQTLILIDTVNEQFYVPLLKQVSKKMLWSFYTALLFEKNIFIRFKDIKFYYFKLKSVYYNRDDIGIKEKVKSHIYLAFILLFGNTFRK